MNGMQAYAYLNHRDQLFEASPLWPGALLWVPVGVVIALFGSIL